MKKRMENSLRRRMLSKSNFNKIKGKVKLFQGQVVLKTDDFQVISIPVLRNPEITLKFPGKSVIVIIS